MDQLYATAAKMATPVLIHGDGRIEWGNRAFLERFAVKSETLPQVQVKELMWWLGILEPIAGMICEGIAFAHCEVPSANQADSTLYLSQIHLPLQPDGRNRMMLVLADEFDPDPGQISIGDH